jgi:CheY-like chemotaxis protein
VFLLEPLLPKNVEIDASYAEPQFPILADTTLVGQLITNLCLNAGEAFEGRDGNVLISLTHAKAQELEALFAAAPNPQERLVGEMGELGPQSDFACLRVLDTAGFIPTDVLEHIFEPFFSTKARKVGAGLGLAVVQSVVASHGGVCHIASREGEGTMFSVYFPLSPLPLGEQPVSGDHKFRGAEGIMIVDDEQDIVEVLSRGLERLGYQTVGIDDPVLALASFEADPDSWDVLLTDQMMPGMTGVQLIAKIRKIKPGIKVICCTGYSKELKLDRASRGGADIVLLKPVTAKDVARQIRLMMQSRLHPAD